MAEAVACASASDAIYDVVGIADCALQIYNFIWSGDYCLPCYHCSYFATYKD